MKKKEVIKHFGSVKATAEALGMTTQNVYSWGDEIPVPSQYRIQAVTNGLFKVRKKK